MKFYIDTCIWLNLFKKEGDSTKGEPYWKIAEHFIDQYKNLIVSTILIRELSFKLNKSFKETQTLLKKYNCKVVKTVPKDYFYARSLETKTNYRLGFYDYLHIAVCKRLNMTLITRDKELIRIAIDLIKVNKPENLIC